jgi:hypothetical protein
MSVSKYLRRLLPFLRRKSPEYLAGQRELIRRATELDDTIVLQGLPVSKMSGALIKFAQPLLDQAQAAEDYEPALRLAVVIWNYAVSDPKERGRLRKPLLPLLAQPEGQQVFDQLLVRKQELYPRNRRLILDYEIRREGDQLHFHVTSTMG